MTIICCSWTVANQIAFCSLIVSIGTAVFLVLNFFNGQRQTKLSLSINQFNIFKEELDGFIEEAKKIRFKSNKEDLTKAWKVSFDESDGISYIHLFSMIDPIKFYNPDASERRLLENDFRTQVIFPLVRYYDKLFHFLNRIKNDKVLLSDYKKILYNYIERDILQNYFRIVNNRFEHIKTYDLEIFETPVFKPVSFYRINQFYIEHNLFEYKDLKFYEDTP